jgi:hypothetical protein
MQISFHHKLVCGKNYFQLFFKAVAKGADSRRILELPVANYLHLHKTGAPQSFLRRGFFLSDLRRENSNRRLAANIELERRGRISL